MPNKSERFRLAAQALAFARIRNRSGIPILVEGKKDRRALQALEFTGPIELVNRGWSMERLAGWFVEYLQNDKPKDAKAPLILLMDWDRTGGRLQSDLRRRLQALDIQVDEELRRVLSKVLKPETRVVESLYSMVDELLEQIELFDYLEEE
jgi:5S rRNA maturation endonuclease (ribonuclease M5)